MLKSLGLACLVFPIASMAVTNTYISEPPSVAVVKKNITDLQKEINSMEFFSAQKIFDILSTQKKEITEKNLLEIYYVLLSFLKVQDDTSSKKELKKKLNSLLNNLLWLYSDKEKKKFSDSVTHLGQLLNTEFFIHLDHKKMSECLDIANHMKDIVEYSNLNNNPSPEDGPDFFSPDFFLEDEITTAQQIYSQVIELENTSKNFSKDIKTMTKEQLTQNIKNANDFVNKLKLSTISVGDKKVRISRNTQKHLKNLTAASIENLVEQKNKTD